MLYVITVYDSLNYGSYFQAIALQNELKKYGDVVFVDIHHQSTLLQSLKQSIKWILKFNISYAYLNLKKYFVFKKARKVFKIIDINNIAFSSNDYYFYGSDEIWNVNRNKIKKSKEFFGFGFPEHNRYSIAVSVNTASFKQLELLKYPKEELNKFNKISVRDKHSKEIVDKLTSRNSEIIGDPTLLYNEQFYKQYEEKINDCNYVLLYTYGAMLNDLKVVEEIKHFAKKNNMFLISIGNWFPFCDKNIAASPGEFLSYIKNASYVITDTFHGLMFSLIYRKIFVIYHCGNIKVEEVLDFLDFKSVMRNNSLSLFNQVSSFKYTDDVEKQINNLGNLTNLFINNIFKNND